MNRVPPLFKRTCQSPAEYASPLERPRRSTFLPILAMICLMLVFSVVLPFLFGYLIG